MMKYSIEQALRDTGVLEMDPFEKYVLDRLDDEGMVHCEDRSNLDHAVGFFHHRAPSLDEYDSCSFEV